MSDFDFTKPQAPKPASPDGFDFTKPPAARRIVGALQAGEQPILQPGASRRSFSRPRARRRSSPRAQKIFEEAEKGGGLFSLKGASRMYYIAEGEVAALDRRQAARHDQGGRDLRRDGGDQRAAAQRHAPPRRPRAASIGLNASELQTALAPEPGIRADADERDVRPHPLRGARASRRARSRSRRAKPRYSIRCCSQQFEAALARPNIIRYQPAQWIMSVGQVGIYMYVVKTGQVAIGIRDKLVEVVNPGGTFGEMALVDQSPRVADAPGPRSTASCSPSIARRCSPP